LKISILHRTGFTILVWFLSVAFAAGQTTYRVERGSVKEYKIDQLGGMVSYSWEIFTDLSLTSLAGPGMVELTPLGAGHENEVQVRWIVEGEFYLQVSIVDVTGCSSRMAWHFVVDPAGNQPIARILGGPSLIVGSCNTAGKVLDASTSSGNSLAYSWFPAAKPRLARSARLGE
jgi:hypothetical protein